MINITMQGMFVLPILFQLIADLYQSPKVC